MNRVFLSVTNDTFTDHRVHKMAKTLFEKGFKVVMVGIKTQQKIVQPNYAKIIRLRMLFKKGLGFYAEYNIKLFFFLLFSKSDVLTANDLDTLLPNYLVAKIRNKKLIFDSHELYVESPEIVNRKRVQNFWTRIEKLCVKGIDYGMTVSEPIALYYQEKYKKEFVVIRNLPNLKVKSEQSVIMPEFFNNEKIILYQGFLNIGRGLEMAIESFRYIDKACFIIIGVGDIEKELKEKVKSLNLENKVFFTGRISQEHLHLYTQKATIGLSVEQNIGKNYEYALPNKLFAYIREGVPVIVSDLPEMRKVVEKYKVGEVFKPQSNKEFQKSNDEAMQFAELITSMINDAEKLSLYKKNCLTAADELCWEKEVMKLPY
ncbi:MAG: glycosyltransferase [Bacteroidetes bacterium]|nr:glycosyltransferase [Bacteroidota bacterium]